MNCPKCGRTFIAPDCYETKQDGDLYINYIACNCPWCNKMFQWKEIFTLTEITYPEEDITDE